MPDREKILLGLKCHMNTCRKSGAECPYWDDDKCSEHLCRDAIALLREIKEKSWIGADKRPQKPGKYLVYGVTFFVPDHNGEPCGYWEIKTANWSDKWGWDCKVKCWRPLPTPPGGDT